jgi:amino acid adenylation domain-containing protein/non-ribosomal peptide synthase protein (TIGR01720 family)
MKFSIGDIQILNEEEREKQLGEWNETEREYPSEKNLHELILGDVGARSAQEAVIVEGSRVYTYGEIGKLSDQVASSLLSKGVKPQEFVPIVLERGIDFIVALLGTLKAGSIYVPLNPDTPDEKLQQVLERIKAKTVITSADLKDRLEGHEIEVLDIEDLKEGGQTSLQGLSRPDDLACAFYSFDDQEKVRLIPLTHRSWVNTVYARKSAFDSPVKRLALLYPPESDKASLTIFWALMEGASLVIPSAIKNWGDTQGILELIFNSQVSHLLCSPGIYRSLLRTAGAKELQSLELISLTGEPWSTDLAQQHIALCPQASLYNEYGLKETGSWNTLARVFDKKSQKCEEVTIGCPIANTQVYIFNDQQQLVPVGVKGEIYIGGIGLLPSSTHSQISERLIPHPYKQGEVLYRTGDIGLYLEDGRIDYMGQRACQISFRGNQIEVEQIEQVLYKHPKVEAAAVSLGNPRTSQERLVGYVQWAGGVPEDTQQAEEEIQKLLKNHLVSYMIPQTWVFVDALKKTSSGKIDRTSLPAIKYEEKAFSIESSTETRSEVEERLVEIWKEILNLDQVSIKDNFFEVGGDSILSIQLVSQARQQGLEFNMEQVFETPTIEELAPFVKITSEQKEKKQEAPLSHQSCTLSPIQYWFLNQEGNNFNHYNQAVLLESKEGIEEEALEKALQSLIRTHKSLQLRFYKDENGTWSQRYEEYESLEEYKKGICRIEDLEGLSNEEVKKKQLEVAEEVQKSLNIQQGPLFQGVLFKEGAKDTLLLVCHHLVVDSVSWRILIEDLEAAYKQALEGKEEIDLPEGTRSYGWWTEALEKLANEEAYQEEISYWEDVLDQQGDPLPRDREGAGENTVEHMGEVTAELPIDLTQKLLQEVPSAYRTQINDILLTALGYAVQEWTGTKRIGLMLEGHGREQLTEEMDLSRTVGWFTSIYPVVLDLEGVESIGSGIKKVKETLRQIPRKGVGYGMLKYLTEEGRKRLSNKEEPDLSFNYLGQVDAGGQKGLFKYTEGSTGSYTSPQNHRPRILEVNSQVINGHLNVHIGYSTHLHSKETITSLSKKFIDALKKIITHCCKEKNFGYTPSDFPLAKINQEQLDQVFGDIANIEDIYPLSPMQEGLLFQKLFHPNSKAYYIQSAFIIDGALNVESFKAAWEILVNSYSILRTGFKWSGLGNPLQFVLHKVKVKVPFEDWSHEEKQDVKLNKYLKVASKSPLNFETPPLIKIQLIKRSANRYYMLWNFHHIILDGWCTPIIIGELIKTYQKLENGDKIHISSRPYKDYINWLSKRDNEESIDFWKNHLQNAKKTLLTFSYGASQENEHKELHDTLPKALSQKLMQAAKNYKITLSDICQFAWGYLLRRYTNQNDILFGITVSGRSIELPQIEDMLGLFINTLPQRLKINNDELIRDVLQKTHRQVVGMNKFSYIPLSKIQSLMEEKDDENLFNTLFIFEGTKIHGDVSKDSGINIKGIATDEKIEYPLTLLIHSHSDEIKTIFLYKNRFFQEEHIIQLRKHYVSILEKIVDETTRSVGDLDLFDDKEKRSILNKWKGQDVPLSEKAHILLAFKKHVEENPALIAVLDKNQFFTYKKLDETSNKVSHFLQKLAADKNTPVVLIYERSCEYVAGLLGIWKTNSIYVPIDPKMPLPRAERIIKQLKKPIIITNRSLSFSLKEGGINNLYCIEDILEVECIDININHPSFEDTAYIIYTSGSTGEPKGVMIKHSSMHNHVSAKISDLKLSERDKIGQTISQSFDVSVWQFVCPLMTGSQMVIIDDEQVLDPSSFSERIFNDKVTILGTVPSLLSILLDGVESNLDLKNKLQSVRTVLLIGEPFTVNLYNRWRKFFPKTQVINAYGPTECADAVTHHSVTSNKFISNTIPINGTIQNMSLYVLGDNLKLSPYGTVGELYIGGIGVAQGYYQLPEQSKQVFLLNPFEEGEKIYKTGDLVTSTLNGTLFFVGRKDKQVKINGCRVELGEIESILLQFPAVKNAIVEVTQQAGKKILVAYYTLTDTSTNVKTDEIRQFLSERLPEYMQPQHFVLLEEIPLTISGKVDRKKLPQIEEIISHKNSCLPRNAIELKLYTIWKELLNIEDFGISDSFTSLGGHSLLAVRLVLQVNKVFNIKLPFAEIKGSSTISSLAQKIDSGFSLKNSSILPIQKSESNRTLFIFHPISGLAYDYVNLSSYIKNWTIYGINDPHLGEEKYNYDTLQKMTSKYLDIIQEITPEGPYYLSGWSFGGLVALEGAIQLTKQGKKVNHVVLIDTYNPIHLKTKNVDKNIKKFLKLMNVSPSSIEGKLLYNEIKKNDFLMQNFNASTYKGPVTLMKAFSTDRLIDAGWKKEILPNLNIVNLTSTHYELFQYPHIKFVAAQLLEILDKD